MELISTSLDGVWKIAFDRAEDERGWFARTYDAAAFARYGLCTEWASFAEAFNARAGTLRGLHLQREPHGETKLIRCIRGSIYDVLLDARPGSPSYARWETFALDDAEATLLYAPAGVAHGYQTLCDETLVHYALSTAYEPEYAAGFRYDSAELAIPWPLVPTAISARDRALPAFTRSAVDT